MRVKLTLLVCVFFLSAKAQTLIKGKVIDESNKPLENVHVYFKTKENVTVTDLRGEFSLTRKYSESDTLFFSMIGYSHSKYSIHDLKKKGYLVKLKPVLEKLGEVVIKEKIKRKKKSLNYTKLTKLKHGVYAFDSKVIEDKVFIVGGDASRYHNTIKSVSELSDTKFIESYKAFLKVMRRYHVTNYVGFSNKLQVYDLKKDEWFVDKSLLLNRANHNINYYDGNMFIIGGTSLSTNKKNEYLNNKIEILNLDSLSVLIDQTNPHQAINFASEIYKNYLIVMGGSKKKSIKRSPEYSDESHFYNFLTGLWYELPKMRVPKETTGVLVKDKFYLIGGFNGQPISNIESFNFITGEWKNELELPKPMRSPGVATKGDEIVIFDKGEVYIFNTVKKTIKKYFVNLDLSNAKVHLYKDDMYIVGGYQENSYSKKPSNFIYKVALKELELTEFIIF